MSGVSERSWNEFCRERGGDVSSSYDDIMAFPKWGTKDTWFLGVGTWRYKRVDVVIIALGAYNFLPGS